MSRMMLRRKFRVEHSTRALHPEFLAASRVKFMRLNSQCHD